MQGQQQKEKVVFEVLDLRRNEAAPLVAVPDYEAVAQIERHKREAIIQETKTVATEAYTWLVMVGIGGLVIVSFIGLGGVILEAFAGLAAGAYEGAFTLGLGLGKWVTYVLSVVGLMSVVAFILYAVLSASFSGNEKVADVAEVDFGQTINININGNQNVNV
jgi:hypothetical protein